MPRHSRIKVVSVIDHAEKENSEEAKMRRVLDQVIVGFFIALYVGFTALIGSQAYREGTVIYDRVFNHNWIEVPGRIVDLKVASGCGRGGRMFNVDLTYQYVIGANRYTNVAIFFGDTGCYSRSAVDQIRQKYFVGQEVLVYANPQRAIDSVLEKRLGRNGTVVAFLIELIVFAFLLSPIYLVWKGRRLNRLVDQKLTDTLLRRSELDQARRQSLDEH